MAEIGKSTIKLILHYICPYVIPIGQIFIKIYTFSSALLVPAQLLTKTFVYTVFTHIHKY
jgi:hypothetical protein